MIIITSEWALTSGIEVKWEEGKDFTLLDSSLSNLGEQ